MNAILLYTIRAPDDNITYLPHLVLLEKLTGSQLVKKFPAFYATRRLLPQSQAPTTCRILSHIDPVHAPTIHFLNKHLNIILPSMPRSSKCLFPSGFPPELCTHLSSPQYMLHVPPISFFSILSLEQYWVKSTDH